jgi:hypothetical protein
MSLAALLAGSTSYRKDPSETTEWDDIQRRLGNLPPLPDPKAEEAEEPAHDDVDPLESKTLEELDELGEEDEYADSSFLEKYREQRLAAIREARERDKYGDVSPAPVVYHD